MKIAIQKQDKSYSKNWIEYCNLNNYEYKLIDCHRSDIIAQLDGCSHFLWHFHQDLLSNMLFAKQLLYSIENMGIKVFPNFNTAWHFDDKIGQKYLLESIGAPFVSTNIFYDKNSALKWAETACYPSVFKLRSGAGGENVKLIKSKKHALKLVQRAFGKGFSGSPPGISRIKQNWMLFKRFKSFDYVLGIIAGFKNYFLPTNEEKLNNIIEKGYFYVQEFLPNNKFDTRIIVVGNRALGIIRYVRENDFRASGSKLFSPDKINIDMRCVKIAFDICKKMNAQSVVYDFVFDQNNMPKILEISYGSESDGYSNVPGYWDSSLKWHPGFFNYGHWMIEDLLEL